MIELMTTQEVMDATGMSKQAIWRAVRAKQIPHQRFSAKGRIRFIRADVEAFIKDRTYSA